MHCTNCDVVKLSEEFIDETLCKNCEHAPLHCLRCVTKCVVNKGKCSQCDLKVNTSNENYKRFVGLLEYMFPKPVLSTRPTTNIPAPSGTAQTIRVVMLTGDFTSLTFNANLTIKAVKEHIYKKLQVAINKQRLLLDGKELQDKKDGISRFATLNDYGIKPFDTLQLIALLYELTPDLDNVIFDLFWGYPASGRDYLDATALIFSGESLLSTVDYRHRNWTGFQHSGDVMDDSKRLGHHTINVSITKIPSNATKIFFTLSAWSSPNISKFKQPSLKFYDAKRPTEQLCSDTMSHAAYSQAIIMCALCKVGGNSWKVYSLGELSPGNAKNYSPIQNTIVSKIIKAGLV